MDLKILVFDNIVCSAGPIVILGNTLSTQIFLHGGVLKQFLSWDNNPQTFFVLKLFYIHYIPKAFN